MEGTVIKSTGSWYVVVDNDGRYHECRIKGKFRLEGLSTTNPVAVGDRVVLEAGDLEGSTVIVEIYPRNNYIIRQSPKRRGAQHIIAANIDQAFLVVTYARPRTSTGFIDRFLITAEAYHIPTHLVFNKQDALSDKELKKQQTIIDIYESIHYTIHCVSALQGMDLDNLKESLKNRVTLFAGHSGVGKSTLINALDPSIDLKTQEISRVTGKGAHTTTFAEMFKLESGGQIIDTPGIKEFGVLDFEPEEVSHYYPEMQNRLQNCQFNNCLHMDEPGCAIKEAVESGEIHSERYKNYCNIVSDVKGQAKHWE